MDPLVLARLATAWKTALAGSVFAGLRPFAGGFELVFDRAPDGDRPGRRLGLFVRFAPPLWAWLDDAAREAGDWLFRLPDGARVRDVVAPPLDRRLLLGLEGPGGGAFAIHLELWAPGNLIAEIPGVRVLWCARPRAASTHLVALAPGTVYAPPAHAEIHDPARLSEEMLVAWFGDAPPERWPALLARQVAGLPKGLHDALVPTLPREFLAGSRDFDALARGLAEWADAHYGAPPIFGAVWDAPSPGASLLSRGVSEGGPAVRALGPFDSWDAAAAGVGRSLPPPVDHEALATARSEVRRCVRAEAAVLSDLEGARRAGDVREQANALAAFLPRVVRGSASVEVPDPADPARTFTIALDPALKPHENADRLFKRAGKLERTLEQAPGRLHTVHAELEAARARLEALERGDATAGSAGPARRSRSSAGAGAGAGASSPGARGAAKAVLSVLEPRRYRTGDGWEVWIGKNNQGNDHLTHRLARPEDIWMHVHGAAGSHVVIRRGKGPNEPSKATLQEVAGWAAFYSQARNAGTVPVTVTQKKYVRKPRKAPAGLAEVMRSKTMFARPTEPPDEARIEDGGT